MIFHITHINCFGLGAAFVEDDLPVGKNNTIIIFTKIINAHSNNIRCFFNVIKKRRVLFFSMIG